MFDDKQLKQAVLDELNWEPSVNAAHIGVTAKAGIVTLMGHVERYSEKIAAENAARRVKDVRAVAEEIDIRLPFDGERGDEEIAGAAANSLKWDASVPSDSVKAKVEKGWVTLTGEVDWHYQQEAAAIGVRGLQGVLGITNEITFKLRPNPVNIRDDIMVALHRSWLDPETITVTAHDGNVKLSGTVESWYGRDVASSTAWAAPGTTSVENNITIV